MAQPTDEPVRGWQRGAVAGRAVDVALGAGGVRGLALVAATDHVRAGVAAHGADHGAEAVVDVPDCLAASRDRARQRVRVLLGLRGLVDLALRAVTCECKA